MKLPVDDSMGEGPNLTPVIDVVFLLLIFFLVATRFDEEERELSPVLPDVVEAEPLAMTSDLVVNITPEGKYVVYRKEYSERQLEALLIADRDKNPSRSVLIRGDGDIAWKLGVRVMGMCKRAEIDDFRVAAVQRK